MPKKRKTKIQYYAKSKYAKQMYLNSTNDKHNVKQKQKGNKQGIQRKPSERSASEMDLGSFSYTFSVLRRVP